MHPPKAYIEEGLSEHVLNLILADSELELIPETIQEHPSVLSTARVKRKSPDKILLDSSLHHTAIRMLGEDMFNSRRGRPDIVHHFLLLTLDSILNQTGNLRVFIHTRNDEVIKIRAETRLPRQYNRFVGLMEQLFDVRAVPENDEPLLFIESKNLKGLVDELSLDKIIVLSHDGRKENLLNYFEKLKDENIACIIGGFSEGDFLSPVHELTDEILSVHDLQLTVWTVACQVLANYEIAKKVI